MIISVAFWGPDAVGLNVTSNGALPACRQRCVAAIRHAVRTNDSAQPLHQDGKTGLSFLLLFGLNTVTFLGPL